jgi:hypothetical protein
MAAGFNKSYLLAGTEHPLCQMRTSQKMADMISLSRIAGSLSGHAASMEEFGFEWVEEFTLNGA